MKAITLHQPWASLIAEGVKTIETRGRRDPWRSVIGETIAVHAGARWPDGQSSFPPLCRDGCWRDEANCPGHITVIPTITDPAHQRPHRTDIRDRVPKASQTPTIFWPQRGAHARQPKENGYGQTSYAPLGAVVATCRLTDVVPILAGTDALAAEEPRPCVVTWETTLTYYGAPNLGEGDNVDSQRSFGDFAPGRWALILDNIVKLQEPVLARGHQGLWTYDAGSDLLAPRS